MRTPLLFTGNTTSSPAERGVGLLVVLVGQESPGNTEGYANGVHPRCSPGPDEEVVVPGDPSEGCKAEAYAEGNTEVNSLSLGRL